MFAACGMQLAEREPSSAALRAMRGAGFQHVLSGQSAEARRSDLAWINPRTKAESLGSLLYTNLDRK